MTIISDTSNTGGTGRSIGLEELTRRVTSTTTPWSTAEEQPAPNRETGR